MKLVLGLLMLLGGIALGLYVGVWLCFIGGIVQLIEAVKAPGGVEALSVAIGLAKIFGASIAGFISATVLIIPGAAAMMAAFNE
ncbi:MAG: hypothetical protein HZA35_02880 [Parcubacteria group bacterium]|nr:hypothetical protein [Parcubacteria group bacterium]